jgi:hypothetical protein
MASKYNAQKFGTYKFFQNDNNNFQFQFIYLRASLTTHGPITKRARGEKTYTNKNKTQRTKAKQ